ncbi:MAG: hypothetical protein GYB65_18905 [Chloroflexi bacterium]|nr:hypothetical protein [Chloroflexota bacterium]
MDRFIGKEVPPPEEDGYVRDPEAQNSDQALADSLTRLTRLKQRERWQRHRLVIIGVLLFVVYFVLGTLTGLWGAGMIFVPVGGFLLGWGLIQEVLAYLSTG